MVSDLDWQPSPDQAGVKPGEAGGYRVEAKGFPRAAYLKPAQPHADEATHCRAAREKIASDLAHDLEVQVPPAVLTRRPNPPQDCTEYVAVSLILYPKQWSWQEIRPIHIDATPAGAALAQVLAACSGLLAFDTWVAQTDHADHPENIVWGYDPQRLADSSVFLLDYANALGFNGAWANAQWRNIAPAPWPQRMIEHLDRTRLNASVQRIEGYRDDSVNEIVTRIPAAYLSDTEKAVITEGLIGRRALLRGTLQGMLA